MANNLLKNEYEIKLAILDGFGRVIEAVIERMMDELERQIMKDVYEHDYFPNLDYLGGRTGLDENTNEAMPSFEFLNAWTKNALKQSLTSVSGGFGYDPSKMSHSGWQHGSVKTGQSVIENMADILNLAYMGYKEGYTSGLEVGSPAEEGIKGDTLRPLSKLRRPYWENFIAKMFDQGYIEKWIREEAKKQGFPLA